MGGFSIASHHYLKLYPHLAPLIPQPILAEVASFFLILVAVVIGAGVCGWWLSRLIHSLRLGWFDRWLGLVLGIGIGGLLSIFGLSLLLKFRPQLGPEFGGSRLAPLIVQLGIWLGCIPRG